LNPIFGKNLNPAREILTHFEFEIVNKFKEFIRARRAIFSVHP